MGFDKPKQVHIINEVLVMRSSRNPNIVSDIDSFLHKNDLWVVMEYMEDGLLKDVVTNYLMTKGQILRSRGRRAEGWSTYIDTLSFTGTSSPTPSYSVFKAISNSPNSVSAPKALTPILRSEPPPWSVLLIGWHWKSSFAKPLFRKSMSKVGYHGNNRNGGSRISIPHPEPAQGPVPHLHQRNSQDRQPGAPVTRVQELPRLGT